MKQTVSKEIHRITSVELDDHEIRMAIAHYVHAQTGLERIDLEDVIFTEDGARVDVKQVSRAIVDAD